ncbi:DsbA family protein [Pasteurellaceae bacterium LIM206]|nr:DsbA family protein [Pasteurellaceae bacterium LIM206]
MKKVLFAVLTAWAAFNVQAADLTEGKQYQVTTVERAAQPEVIEFFSFYCPHCYSFEMEYKIPQKVESALPQGVKFTQYHVNFLGGLSEDLTRAWALAMALGVENKVKDPLFRAVHENKLRSAADIRQIFLDNGVSAEQYDGGINSFAVNALVSKQVNLADQLKVRGVPDFYVNNKFRVNPEGLSHDDFINDYVNTVKALLNK